MLDDGGRVCYLGRSHVSFNKHEALGDGRGGHMVEHSGGVRNGRRCWCRVTGDWSGSRVADNRRGSWMASNRSGGRVADDGWSSGRRRGRVDSRSLCRC